MTFAILQAVFTVAVAVAASVVLLLAVAGKRPRKAIGVAVALMVVAVGLGFAPVHSSQLPGDPRDEEDEVGVILIEPFAWVLVAQQANPATQSILELWTDGERFGVAETWLEAGRSGANMVTEWTSDGGLFQQRVETPYSPETGYTAQARKHRKAVLALMAEFPPDPPQPRD